MATLTTTEIDLTLAYYECTSRRPICASLETIQAPLHHASLEQQTKQPLAVACESIQSACDWLGHDEIRKYLDVLIKITAFMIQRTRGYFVDNPLHHLVQRTISMLEAKVIWSWDEGYSSSY